VVAVVPVAVEAIRHLRAGGCPGGVL